MNNDQDKDQRPPPGTPVEDGGRGALLVARPWVEPIVLIASLGLIVAGLAAARTGWPRIPEVRIALGFFIFFVAPGLLLSSILLAGKLRAHERLPAWIALSMGVWAFPGLLAYLHQWSLETVISRELFILAMLWALAIGIFWIAYPSGAKDFQEPSQGWSRAAVGGLVLALAALAAWTGAFRGVGLDWDYFNYISGVRKLLVWDRASIAHFAYADAPPDPIHSYNIWGLQWALLARLFGLDPIGLYARSAFLTMPAAALSFYSLARRLFPAGPARTALILFACYHVIYGGLLFLGRTTFYPADSQWLVIFPACLTLLVLLLENRRGGCLPGLGATASLCLAALAMSITHVLWGLCFYLVLGFLFMALLGRRLGLARAFVAAWQDGKSLALAAVAALAAIPMAVTAIDCALMIRSDDLLGYTPLLGSGIDLSVGTYALVFVLAPAAMTLLLIWNYRPRRPEPEGGYRELLWLVASVAAICLLVAAPYVLLRREAIEVTNWSMFGRNPYRAMLTSSLFFLNPFQHSLQDPNMTFYPLYLLGYLCLPLLWHRAGIDYKRLLALAVLVAVPLICFHPVLASLFAQYFTLGYLRRLLRLAALFSIFPAAILIGAVVEAVFPEARRPGLNLGFSFLIAAAIAGLCVLFPASSYYNQLARKTIIITRSTSKDSLIYDDRPFREISRGEWFAPGEVIFSDVWTSYRLTAYLPQFVAVQHKPGTGVPDQDERRTLEVEFFDPATPVARMREILERFAATGVIVNRNPTYEIYGYLCGHPEAAGKLKGDRAHFEPLFEEGDWLIFRYVSAAGR